MPAALKVVELGVFNFRDPASTLRKIADQIDRNELGPVSCVGIVVMANELNVYGAGPDADAPSIGLSLHAGFMKMSQMLLDHHGDSPVASPEPAA